jgi:hypothetical protein
VVRHNIAFEDVLSFSHGRPTIATLEHFLPGQDHSEELDAPSRFEETQTDGILAVPPKPGKHGIPYEALASYVCEGVHRRQNPTTCVAESLHRPDQMS